MDSGTLGLASALAELGIYELADLVEMARAGGLHEMIVHVVAIDQGQLEQRLEQAVRIHKLAADRRAALLSQAEARAAAAERLHRQAEARHTVRACHRSQLCLRCKCNRCLQRCLGV